MADFRLRVTFSKSGRLGMLSHLELARALERAVRRADLPYAVTQGFSPHMKIAYGAALPVGVESTCEIFDVSLTEYVPAEEALSRLAQVSALDLMPHAARYLQQGEAAASVAFPISRYEVRLSADCGGAQEEGEGSASGRVHPLDAVWGGGRSRRRMRADLRAGG